MLSAFRVATPTGVAVALFAFVLPFVTSRELFYGAINAKYFYIVGATSLLALLFCSWVIRGRHVVFFRGRKLLFLLGILLAVSLASSFLGVYLERSLFSDILRSSGVQFLICIGLLSWVAAELLTKSDWILVRRAIAASSTLLALATILGAQGLGFSGRILTVNLDIVGATLANETFTGAYLLLGLIITIIELSTTAQGRTRALLGAAAAIQFFSPLLFGAKALLGADVNGAFSLVGTARASSVTAILFLVYLVGLFLIRYFGVERRFAKALLSWSVLWFAGLALLVGLLFVPGSFVQEAYVAESTKARLIVWGSGFEAFKDRPLFGWGPENFRYGFAKHFNNELYLQENIGEIWFDRAHNLVIDTLVATGLVGMAALLFLWGYFVYVCARAARAGLISSTEAHLWGALVVAHFFQLQTSFDTVATYTLMGIVLGYGIWLERSLHSKNNSVPPVPFARLATALFIGAFSVGSLFFVFGEHARQKALYRVFITKDSVARQEFLREALSRESNFETARFAFASLRTGFFEKIAKASREEVKTLVATTMPELALYEAYFRAYVAENPDDYRARVNLSYLLLFQTSLGENKIVEARPLIEGSYELSPANPITYVLDGVAHLYSGNLKVARERIEAAVALNPEAPFSKDMLTYLSRQEAKFPSISVLDLKNL